MSKAFWVGFLDGLVYFFSWGKYGVVPDLDPGEPIDQ